MTGWVNDRVRELEAVRGGEVVHWRAVEMALRDVGGDGLPQFHDDALPVLQLGVIHVTFADHDSIALQTYQDNDECGIFSMVPDAPLSSFLDDGIFRTRDLDELPRGTIEDVQVQLSERGNISRVTLSFGNGTTILLVAGEAYEQMDGPLRFARDDESILVFRSPSDESAIPWI